MKTLQKNSALKLYNTQDKQKAASVIHVSMQNFEGPLDLLLFLVKKSKINIYDIPIAEITMQYLEYLNTVLDKDLENLSSFYQMASFLLLIKSKTLLPTNDEELDLEEMNDPRSELIEKLIEYQKYKKLSGLLGNVIAGQPPLLLREETGQLPLSMATETEWKEVDSLTLLHLFLRVLESSSEVEKFIDLQEEVTINQKITLIYEQIEKKSKICFQDIVGKGGILALVCSFLAVLELLKLQVIRVMQKQAYETIYILKRNAS